MGGLRMAGDTLLSAVNPFRMEGNKIVGIRPGRVGGGAAILSLLAAANELNDPNESAGRNLAQAAGTGVVGLGGSALGAIVGQTLLPFLPGVGALAGATVGGMLGSGAGEALASAAADVVEGSPESRALRSMQEQARASTELEAARIASLMPLQDQAAQIALKNEEKRNRVNADIAGQLMLQQALAQGLLAQQTGSQGMISDINRAILGG